MARGVRKGGSCFSTRYSSRRAPRPTASVIMKLILRGQVISRTPNPQPLDQGLTIVRPLPLNQSGKRPTGVIETHKLHSHDKVTSLIWILVITFYSHDQFLYSRD